jgi:hypothetical protein
MEGLDETRLVDFLEAAYALERSDEEWLTETLRALDGVCKNEDKYLGLFYDASNVERLEVWNPCGPPGSSEPVPEVWQLFWSIVSPDSFSCKPCRTREMGA